MASTRIWLVIALAAILPFVGAFGLRMDSFHGWSHGHAIFDQLFGKAQPGPGGRPLNVRQVERAARASNLVVKLTPTQGAGVAGLDRVPGSSLVAKLHPPTHATAVSQGLHGMLLVLRFRTVHEAQAFTGAARVVPSQVNASVSNVSLLLTSVAGDSKADVAKVAAFRRALLRAARVRRR